ncbi:MAG: YcgL domain-containing protein [Enterobacteriaceae bacterium]|jgi:uncharacterized protein YcgL (UPF0745 family)|nr:YcgL domain-containing protein [Enterobacteriaceae bacterium]
MLCAIYRSSKRDQTYLYTETQSAKAPRDENPSDFSKIPDELMATFGKPVFVMILDLEQREKLASADILRVKQDLTEKGFYLQVPPPIESLLQRPEEFGWSIEE